MAVTATAAEYAGVYRGKQYHPRDIDGVLDRASRAGVEKVLLTGMSLPDVPFDLSLASKRREQCRITVGVHPYHAGEAVAGGEAYAEDLASTISKTLREEPDAIGAFGELGLDYDHLDRASKLDQMATFTCQLDMIVFNGWELPLFLHCRAAFDDFITILGMYMDKLPLRAGLVHSFVGTAAQMQQLVSLGLHVSVNGFSFRDRESLEMVRAIPLDKLQIETDAPWGEIQASSEVAKAYVKNATEWLWGAKKRGKWEEGSMVKERNESCTMERVAMVVAGLKGISVEEVAEHAWRNSTDMFFGSRGDTKAGKESSST